MELYGANTIVQITNVNMYSYTETLQPKDPRYEMWTNESSDRTLIKSVGAVVCKFNYHFTS
jgi:hypothetical protein